MGFSPLPDPLGVQGSAEVGFVPRLLRPLKLAARLGGPLAFRLGAIALMPPIAGIGTVFFIAVEALEGGLDSHRQTWNKLPNPHVPAPRQRRKSRPRPQEEDPEEDAGRRVSLEALEEDPARSASDVHTAGSIGLPNRR